MKKLFVILVVLLFFSCKKTLNEPDETTTEYRGGAFVVNEGVFMHANASISFIDEDYKVYYNIFKKANNENLGDVAQDLCLFNNKAYVVVNASNKIEVVDAHSMERITQISDARIKNPRYMLTYGSRGYISNWGVGVDPEDDSILVLDLSTDEIIASIPVGFVPNYMHISHGKLYVLLQGWYPDINNKIAVIDLSNNTWIKNIEIGAYPTFITEYNESLYVICNGFSNEFEASMAVINPSNDTLIKNVVFENGKQPNFIANDQHGLLYYTVENSIYKWDCENESLPETPVLDMLDNKIYGLKIHDDKLYINTYKNASGQSFLYLYDLQTLKEVHEPIETGLFSNAVVFSP